MINTLHLHWVAVWLLLGTAVPGLAQESVNSVAPAVTQQITAPSVNAKGQVVEKESGQSLPYATITIRDNEDKVLKRLASDGEGRFEVQLPPDSTYTLVVSSVGFQQFEHSFTLPSGKKSFQLGQLKVKEGVDLQEVTVTTFKPLVKNDVDKLTYNMESDPEAQSNNILDMLRKVPMLTVDAEENIKLNGQSNFKVLMNGKSSSMLSGNLKDVLKSIPAHTIKDIEVITNPSSKYDAEGVGGIINIVTTKTRMDGIFGSVGASANQFGGFSGNLYLSSKIDKFSVSARYYDHFYRNNGSETEYHKKNFISEEFRHTDTYSHHKYHGNSQGLSLEASYDIDTLNLLTLSLWGNLGRSKSTQSSYTQEFDLNDILSRAFENNLNGDNGYGGLSGNIDYQRTFKKPDKSFTVSYKVDCNPSDNDGENSIENLFNYYSYRQKNKNDANGQEHTVQMDYYDPLTEKHQIEGGLKYIFRRNTSNSQVYLFEDGEWVYQPERINDLDYDQHILGLYGGYVFKLKKFSTKAGLRMERTWNDGVFKSKENTEFNNHLFNVIPYVTLAYKLKESQNLKVSYTQRLSRPGIWYLNPYVNDIDPFNINYGNPNLDSELSHAFSADYGYFSQKYNVNASLSYHLLNNGIERVSWVDTEGVTTTTYKNIGHRKSVGLSLYGSANFTDKFNMNLHAYGNYVDISSGSEGGYQNSGFSVNAYMGMRYISWEGGSFSLNGGIYSPTIWLQGRGNTYYFNSISFTQQLLEKKLSLMVSVTDPFEKNKKSSSSLGDDTFHSNSISRRPARSFRLSISYRFGKMNVQVKKARRGISNDDVKSGGSSQGSN